MNPEQVGFHASCHCAIALHLSPFAVNVLPQPPQSMTAVLRVNSLNLGGLVLSAQPCKCQRNRQQLDCAPGLLCLFYCRLLFGLWVVAVDQTLDTGTDDPQNEVCASPSLLTKILADHEMKIPGALVLSSGAEV